MAGEGDWWGGGEGGGGRRWITLLQQDIQPACDMQMPNVSKIDYEVDGRQTVNTTLYSRSIVFTFMLFSLYE